MSETYIFALLSGWSWLSANAVVAALAVLALLSGWSGWSLKLKDPYQK